MQYLWTNLHFSVSSYLYPRLIDIIFPEETKTETQTANLKITPDKMALICVFGKYLKVVPLNKGMMVMGSLQCLSVLLIWVIVGQVPANN